MISRFKLSALLFYGITVLMAAVILVSLIGGISWINKPFAGFLVYKFRYVGSVWMRDWPGAKAGLKIKDHIIAVDGQAIRKGKDLVAAVSKKEPGTPVRYTIKLKDKTRDVSVPVATFSVRDFFMVFLIPFLGGLPIYVLGVIVYLLKPNTKTSWVFLTLCFGLGTYVITGFEIQSSYFFVHLHWIIIPLFPATFVHLGLIFPDRKKLLDRFPFAEYLIYLPALILIIGYQIHLFNYEAISSNSSWGWMPSLDVVSMANWFFTLFSVATLIFLVLYSFFKSLTSTARERAKMILFGVSIAFLPPAIIMLLAVTIKFTFPYNFLVFFVIFFPAAIAYSIIRHNLFDADIIIKRTVGYFVTTGIVIGAYAVVSLSLNVLLGKYQVTQSQAFPILFTIGVILIFNPLRNRIQALVDRLFFRKEYDYGQIVDKIGGAITSLMDLGQILNRLTQTFIEDMFIDTTSVMLLSSDGSTYKVYLADGENRHDVEQVSMDRDDPLVRIIEKGKKELTKYDLLEDRKYRKVSASCVNNFESLHASLMVPLVFQDKVIGLLNLGEKKSGKFYNREDIDLLHAVSNQGAVAIENARLFQENLEKQRMEEELNIARDLQISMLPAECPQIEGFEIAAYSVSAREVGGDFYDFIEMGANKAGMVIGDVTGKSVSGALVMSASRTLFRMLSEEELSVKDSMMRANQRLKKDVKSGMFVALLYAVIDSQDKILTLCSAGQTQPVHVSARTGEGVLVETQGDTFPLGILDDSKYEETRLQLEAGDKIVLYTDGIVEAMNEKEEMYGFERLQEVVKGSQSESAESLLKTILENVKAFTGEAELHDDLTAIVVSVTR